VRGPLLLPAVAAGLLALAAGCAHDFRIEERDTPVHVWVSAPAGAGGTRIPGLVYLGAHKILDGTLTFPPGVSTVVLPTVHVDAGRHALRAVFAGGSITLEEDVVVSKESWVHLTVAAGGVTARTTDEEPRIPR
jgi:hypothetical protein